MLSSTTAFLPAFLALLNQGPVAGTRDSASTTTVATATAARAEETMTIDGRDSERVWGQAARYSNFRQFQPRVNAEPSQRTEFRARSRSAPERSGDAACAQPRWSDPANRY